MKDKITREEVAQRMLNDWKFNQYDHGGSRSYIDGESGDRQLIIDTYYNSTFAEYMDDCAKNYFAPTLSVGNQEDSLLSTIIERSHPELKTKMKRLMAAVKELHPTLAMDDPKQEELYLSLHSLKESVTSL